MLNLPQSGMNVTKDKVVSFVVRGTCSLLESSENKSKSSTFKQNTSNTSDSNQNCTDFVTENLSTDGSVITAEKCFRENRQMGNKLQCR